MRGIKVFFVSSVLLSACSSGTPSPYWSNDPSSAEPTSPSTGDAARTDASTEENVASTLIDDAGPMSPSEVEHRDGALPPGREETDPSTSRDSDEGDEDEDAGVSLCVEVEFCDGIDNNCDGLIDEFCGSPSPCIEVEFCDGIDNNCDGVTDEYC